MLNLLKICNVALIDELTVEFGPGLNLLTGETGSGKSIIVDSLGALTGERVTTDLIKQGEGSAVIEGLFLAHDALRALLDESGVDAADEVIVRREISLAGRNRIFVNGQLVTQAFLKHLGSLLVDIHGQGEQTALYDVDTHIGMLDDYAGVDSQLAAVADVYREWASIRSQIEELKKDDSEKLQLLDILHERGYTPLAGDGHDDSGSWPPEPTWFVIGMGEAEAVITRGSAPALDRRVCRCRMPHR